MRYHEVNFDGLVGPTHNYAGLSYGNVASASNKGRVANPREGVLQGLAKMRHLMSLGLVQGVLPPHERPHLPTLRALGFQGGDAEILAAAARHPALLVNVTSAATMWTANAATVSPALDTADGRIHFTPANLAAMFHRAIEPDTTAAVFRRIFPECDRFAHHDPLIGGHHMGDEGAANHCRFSDGYGAPGVALFVYGRNAFETDRDLSYPGRQTREASEAIARQHGLDPSRTVFARQSAKAINAGAFHNDVVAVSNGPVFFHHEEAFADPDGLARDLNAAYGDGLQCVTVPADRVGLQDAVTSYLFNSQLVSVPGRERMTLILPGEVNETPAVKDYLDDLIASGGPIGHHEVLDVRQSMRNGGGPACLRLRVVLSEDDLKALGAQVILDADRIEQLEAWAHRHYRDRLLPEDLGDPALMEEGMTALDDLTDILGLGSLYAFQR